LIQQYHFDELLFVPLNSQKSRDNKNYHLTEEYMRNTQKVF
jgi:hypothetical protein